MKNVKKLLAVLMCAAMLFGLAPIGMLHAAASSNATAYLKVGRANEPGAYNVSICLKNAVGFTDGSFTVTYDPAVLSCEQNFNGIGVFAEELEELNQQVMTGVNATEAGTVTVGVALSDEIRSEEDYYDNFDGFVPSFDPEDFELCTLRFYVTNSSDWDTTLRLNGDFRVSGSTVEVNSRTTIKHAAEPVEPQDTDPHFGFEVLDVTDSVLTLSLVAYNCIGLTTFGLRLNYDPDAVSFKNMEVGADAVQVADCVHNSFSYGYNYDTAGLVLIGGYFNESLWTAEQFAADAKKPGTVNINADAFEMAVLTFDINDGAEGETLFSVEVTNVSGVTAGGSSVTAALSAPVRALTLNEPCLVELGAGETAQFSFTAPFTGSFAFYSSGTEEDPYPDTYGILYDGDWNQIDSDDESGGYGHFKITYWMTEGETCYLNARNYYWDAASFYVAVEHDHEFTSEPVTVASCTQEGENRLICNCPECGYETSETVPMLLHVDKNRDGKCDNCGNEVPVTDHGTLSGTYWYEDEDPSKVIEWELRGDGTLLVTGKGVLNTWMFSNREDIVRVEIGEGITGIGEYTFTNDSCLAEVELPSTLTLIDRGAFTNCVSLESVTVPAAATELNGCFAGCVGLKEYKVADGNASYTAEDGVLYNKDKTELISYPPQRAGSSFTVPATVTALADRAFAYSGQLTEISFPAGLASVGAGTFIESGWFDAQPDGPVYAGGVLVRYKGKAPETLTVKDGTLGVGANALNPFYGWSDSYMYGDLSAFYDYATLTTLNLPDSLQQIGNSAFVNCVGLKNVNFGKGVKKIGTRAFSSCDSLEKAALPDSVTELGQGAFADCGALSSLTLSAGLSEVPDFAFESCRSLTEVTVPGNVKTVSSYAFAWCERLQKVTVEQGVKTIDRDAFWSCPALTDIILADSVTVVKRGAFDETKWNNDLWEEHDFDGPAEIVYVGKVAYECIGNPSTLTTLTLKDDTVSVSDYAFYNAGALTTLKLPYNLQEIGAYSFANSGLEELFVPASVTHIGQGAFRNSALKTVNYDGSADDWKKIVIEDGNETLLNAKINYGVADHTHAAGEPVRQNDVKPTCTEKGGYDSVTFCTVCGKEMSRTKMTLNALGHKPSDKSVKEKEVKPTCTAAGSYDTVVYCTVCNKEVTRKTTTVEALGHTWDAGVVTTPSTAEKEGVKTFTCTVCGIKQTEPIPKKISTAQFTETGTKVYAVPKQNVSDLLELAGEGAKITDQNGNPVKSDAKIGSGMKLTLADGSEEVIVVKGDNNGDGVITAADARFALRSSVQLEKPNDWQKDASLIEGAEKITAADARMILRASVNLEKPEQWLKK